jgi:hypothetical protein
MEHVFSGAGGWWAPQCPTINPGNNKYDILQPKADRDRASPLKRLAHAEKMANSVILTLRVRFFGRV